MRKSNNSLNRSAISLAFIVNLAVPALNARPVNSSVRHASHSQKSRGVSNEMRKADEELNNIFEGRSNDSFNRSANSGTFIARLAL